MSFNYSGMNRPFQEVVIHKAFADLNWNTKNDVELKELMQQAINEDPLISDPSLVSVTLEKEDGERVFTLLGKVKDDKEMQRAEQIVETNAQKNASVKNSLIIDNN